MNPGGVCPQMACPQMACPHQDPENEKREAYLRFWTDLNSAEPSRHEVEVRRVNVKAGQCCSCVEEEVEAVGLWRPADSDTADKVQGFLSCDFVAASSLPRARRFFTGSVLWAMWGGSEPELAHVLPDLPRFMRGTEKAREMWMDKLGVVPRPPPTPLDRIVMGWGSFKESTIRSTVLRCLRQRLWEPAHPNEHSLGELVDVQPQERAQAYGVPAPLALWAQDPTLLSVEPDGLLVIPRQDRELPPLKIVLEIKCPNPFDRRPVRGSNNLCCLQMPRMYPTFKLYYLLQILCECRAYDTPHVLFGCGTPLGCRAWFYTFSSEDLALLDEWLPHMARLRDSARHAFAEASAEAVTKASAETVAGDSEEARETDVVWRRFAEEENGASFTDVLKQHVSWMDVQLFWRRLSTLHSKMCADEHVVMDLCAQQDASVFVPHCGALCVEDFLKEEEQ